MHEVYPDGEDQWVPDDDWIELCGERNWVALTKDGNLHRAHEQAITASGVRVFALNSSALTGDEMAARIIHHLHRMIQRAGHPGPFIDVLHADRIERRWPERSSN